ncbi:MAG: hypothetical protein WD876_00115 [Candidatus Pacearchaeota archaeon]
MKNLIQNITKGAGKGIAPLLLAGMFGVGAYGCASGTQNSKYLPNCFGSDIKYNNLEVVAQAKDGQKLVKAEGRFYAGDEDCFIDHYNQNANVSYSSENGKKILTVKDKDSGTYKMVWSENGDFHKEIGVQ